MAITETKRDVHGLVVWRFECTECPWWLLSHTRDKMGGRMLADEHAETHEPGLTVQACWLAVDLWPTHAAHVWKQDDGERRLCEGHV